MNARQAAGLVALSSMLIVLFGRSSDGSPAHGSGNPGAVRGRSMQSLMAGGLSRSFTYYGPATLDPNTPAPVVILPNGYMMNADMMFEITRYSDLADPEKKVRGRGQTGIGHAVRRRCADPLHVWLASTRPLGRAEQVLAGGSDDCARQRRAL